MKKPNKDTKVCVRLTASEEEELMTAAKNTDLSLSDYIRFKLFGRVSSDKTLLSDTTDERIYHISKHADVPLLAAILDDDTLYELHGIHKNRLYGLFRAREDGDLEIIMQIHGDISTAREVFRTYFHDAYIIEDTIRRLVIRTRNNHRSWGDMYIANVIRREAVNE